jgi:hypothetical protein
MNACHCDGTYDGCEHGERCPNPGGGHRSPYFCSTCDPRRIAHITAQFEEITRGGFDAAVKRQAAVLAAVPHELKYRAGSRGLAKVGISDVSTPHWYCTCGLWKIPRDLQGRPFEETAKRHHRQHVKAMTEVEQ